MDTWKVDKDKRLRENALSSVFFLSRFTGVGFVFLFFFLLMNENKYEQWHSQEF